MKPACQFCQHYNRMDDKMGECRRKPPVVAFHTHFFRLHETTVFPKVRRNDFCGKHKEKENGK